MTGGHLLRYVAASSLAVLFAVAGLASPAYAHTELDNAIPAAGSTLGTTPGTIQLTFTEPVDADLATVVVRGPDGALLSDGAVRQSATGLMQPIVPTRKAGMLEVSYRVISLDGHPVSDTFRFEVTRGDPNAQPPGSDQSQAAGAGGGGDDSGGSLTAPLIGAAAVLLLIVVGALVARRRRDSAETAQPSVSPPPASPPATPPAS
ncbi:MAG TPA: copper resistance protein CopC [Nocardioidaceae bacterium]|nr:copper resistance protein CopC [Nocardioidaceae bacterium]